MFPDNFIKIFGHAHLEFSLEVHGETSRLRDVTAAGNCNYVFHNKYQTWTISCPGKLIELNLWLKFV